MWNWKYYFIEVILLLLLKVSNTESGCSWEDNSPASQKYCSIKCKGSLLSAEQITVTMKNLDKELAKRNCSEDGIDLELENLKYSDNIVKKNFFTAQVKVRQLSISLVHTNIISISYIKLEVDAFNVDSLKFVKKLVIDNINFSPIKKGTFNGFENLEVLNIKGAQLKVIETGVLDVLNDTLNEFSVEEVSALGSEISIEGLTGSGAMEKLENVKFRYNLNTSIARNTLVGLPNVKTLDLSKCKIETIAFGAFDSMSFIEQLKLEDNYLTIIPNGFFDVILIRNRTQIFLKGNRFICDCEIMPFKLSLIDNSNFVGALECHTPEKLDGHSMIETSFCESYVPPSTELTTPFPKKACVSSDESEKTVDAFIEAQTQSMQIIETDNDGVVLRVDRLEKKSVLIWFTSNDQAVTDDINCLISSGTSFQINNLIKNSAYTFCLMDQMTKTVSPLDCISYMKRSDSKALPWLYDNNKGQMIGIALVVYGINILLGLAIGISANKLKVLKNNRKKSFVRSYHSSVASSMRRSRMSVMTSDSYLTKRTTNSTVQYYLNESYDAPPLPARPVTKYLKEEPDYAEIRDFSSINAIISAPIQATDSV